MIHCERFRVGWVDTDASGRIHFTAVFRWVEAVESSIYRRLGVFDGGVGHLPRRHVEADFLVALGFEDEVEVCADVAAVGTTSITFDWRISRDGETAVRGRHTAVHVDENGQPLAIGEEARVALIGRPRLARSEPPSA